MTRPTAPLPLTTTPPDMQGELQFLREELAALRKENEELRRLVLGAAAPEPRLAFVTPAPAFDHLPSSARSATRAGSRASTSARSCSSPPTSSTGCPMA